ncbi:hypothetical protein J6590_010050 [Homalodisca vitripennis]|nr:hypothetical protein J6590_010050 [Homalodisca vitripennis]
MTAENGDNRSLRQLGDKGLSNTPPIGPSRNLFISDQKCRSARRAAYHRYSGRLPNVLVTEYITCDPLCPPVGKTLNLTWITFSITSYRICNINSFGFLIKRQKMVLCDNKATYENSKPKRSIINKVYVLIRQGSCHL